LREQGLDLLVKSPQVVRVSRDGAHTVRAQRLSALPPYWSVYPMQLRHLPDGRDLIVWAQYDDLVTKMGSDYYYREATASSVWSLLLDGGRAQVQRLSLSR